jgi:hypothetical protein
LIVSTGGVFKDSRGKKGKKYDIIVIRIAKDQYSGMECLANARPCKNCLDMMKAINIHRVYYSNNKGDIIYENVKDMISIHSSSVMFHIDVNAKVDNLKKTNQSDRIIYWEKLIKEIVPTTMKQNNFDKFVCYDFESIMAYFKLKIAKIPHSGIKQVHFINGDGIIIKTTIVV